MHEIKEFLLALPEWQLWLIGGAAAEVILQIIKRYLWQPPDYEKAKERQCRWPAGPSRHVAGDLLGRYRLP